MRESIRSMKKRCLGFYRKISFLSLMSLLLLLGCKRGGIVQEELQPRYYFEMDESQSYDVSFNIDMTVEAILFSFTGNIGLTGEMQFKAVDTNEMGYEIQVSILNPQVTGGNAQLNTIAMSALNFIRTYMSTIYLTPEGELTILYNEKPHPALMSYGRLLLPDFSDMEALADGVENNTNFASKYQEMLFMTTFEHEAQIARTTDEFIKIDNELQLNMYDHDNYSNTVDPIELVEMEMTFNDKFDYHRGKLMSKNGYFFLEGSLRLSQGILAITVSLSGSGSFDMEEITDEELS